VWLAGESLSQSIVALWTGGEVHDPKAKASTTLEARQIDVPRASQPLEMTEMPELPVTGLCHFGQ
jgi:hypothetical protein